MAKISQQSSKYIIRANIEIEGVVDRPDVVGAIFGQIEGLLGADLELRELQRSGRIGRIEVDVESENGKTIGTIVIPSSLDKAETAIIGGALEIIERIGPCVANIKVTRIEDERANKRQQVINRAKELLKSFQDSELPDSHELSNEVSSSVRTKEITTYGDDNLPCGPDVDKERELIVVEGRADVLNLLRNGFKNVIALNGTKVPQTIKDLSKHKILTLFCDGDRGGDLIIKEALATCDVDYITKAPDGKEVEELQKKEIHQAIRSKIPVDEYKQTTRTRKTTSRSQSKVTRRRESTTKTRRKPVIKEEHKKLYRKLYDEIKGSDDVYVLDKKKQVLGRIPQNSLEETLPGLNNVGVLIVGSTIEDGVARAIDKARIRLVVASEAKNNMRSTMVPAEDLE